MIIDEGYVDISRTKLDVYELYGIEFAERLLRKIGLERILFGTDYHIFLYGRYFKMLNRMSFIDERLSRSFTLKTKGERGCFPGMSSSSSTSSTGRSRS